VNAKDAIGGDRITQFGRVLSELNIDIICANSPQAKGRVERAFGTLQNRLVKGPSVAACLYPVPRSRAMMAIDGRPASHAVVVAREVMKYRSDLTPPEPGELAAIAKYDLVILRRNREAKLYSIEGPHAHLRSAMPMLIGCGASAGRRIPDRRVVPLWLVDTPWRLPDGLRKLRCRFDLNRSWRLRKPERQFGQQKSS
jgi:hypothetical protein